LCPPDPITGMSASGTTSERRTASHPCTAWHVEAGLRKACAHSNPRPLDVLAPSLHIRPRYPPRASRSSTRPLRNMKSPLRRDGRLAWRGSPAPSLAFPSQAPEAGCVIAISVCMLIRYLGPSPSEAPRSHEKRRTPESIARRGLDTISRRVLESSRRPFPWPSDGVGAPVAWDRWRPSSAAPRSSMRATTKVARPCLTL